MSDSLSIPKGFQKVILVVAGMNLQMFLLGLKAGGSRRKYFNQEFMQENFGKEHERQLKEPIKYGGAPDMGSGRYSQKLSYRDWHRFNVLQRNHYNYLENINFASTAVIGAGLVDPNYGVAVGLTYILARFLYSFFYQKEGGAHNKIRKFGVALGYLSTLVGLGIFIKKFFYS